MAIIVTGGRPIFGIGVNGPYPPLDWPFGGFPTISTDIAIMSVFLFLFLIGFIIHLALFFVNLVRGRFIVQFLMTFFCLLAMAALILRIASTVNGYNGEIYIASQIFIASMEVLLIFTNLAYAHQVIRTQHGGGIISTIVFIIIYFFLFLAWAMQLGGIGQTFFTLDGYMRYVDYNLQIWATTFYAVASLLPLIFVAISTCLPGRHRRASASLYLSIWVLIVGSLLVAVQAWYIAGVTWMGRTNRFLSIPSFMTRAWYYVIIWTIDIIIVFLYIFARVDRHAAGAGGGRYNAGGARPAAAAGYASGPWGGAAAGPGSGVPRKKRRFGLGKLALGAGAGGMAAMALRRHRRKREEKEEMRREDLERVDSPGPRRQAGPGIPRDMEATAPLGSHPTKEVRGFDTETIPEETEESDDSLYAVDSTMGTDSKRHSAISAPERTPTQTPKPV